MSPPPPTEGPPAFSLVRGGPLHTLRTALRLGNDRMTALVLVGVTWFPLMILALIAWRTGHRSALAADYSVHVRLLLAVPLLFEAERSMHMRTKRCIERFVGDRWAAGAEARIQRAIRTAERLRDAVAPEVILLAIATLMSQALYRNFTPFDLLHDRAVGRDWAPLRAWYAFVSLPILQFLFGRWLWRWAIWCWLLWRLARLPIAAVATHPDRRGGLGFLAEPSVGFGYVMLASSAVQASVWAEKVANAGAHVTDFKLQIGVLVAGDLAVAFGPLLLFSLCLWRCRFEAMRRYDDLANAYTRMFQQRWIDGREREGLLGAADIQSLADLGTACGVIREMRLIPVELKAVLVIAVATLLPMVPLAMMEVPLVELIQKLGAVALGGATEK